jgi:hypothetical protein
MRDKSYDIKRPCLCVGHFEEGEGQHYVSLQAKDPNTLRRHVAEALGSNPYTSTDPFTDDLGTLDTGPARPLTYYHHPLHKNTPSDAEFVKKHWFIEYSVSRKALFCFPCRIFYDTKWPHKRPDYTEYGVKDWQNIGSRLTKHGNETTFHAMCTEKLDSHYRF